MPRTSVSRSFSAPWTAHQMKLRTSINESFGMKPATIPEAAELLGRSPQTLYRWVRLGAPVCRPGSPGRGHAALVRVAELTAWWTARRSPPGSRWCTRCGRTKPVSEFPSRRYSAARPARPASACRACERDRHRARRQAERDARIAPPRRRKMITRDRDDPQKENQHVEATDETSNTQHRA